MSEEPRRLNLYLSERATLPASGDGDRAHLGEIYSEPFTGALRVWSFSGRVLSALVEHAWQPTQRENQLNVVFTPALRDGEARVVDRRDHFHEVFVGLSRDRWSGSTIAEKRRILVDTFVSQLEPLREKYALDWPALQVAAESLIARYETILAPVGEPSPVAVGTELAEKVRIGPWTRATPAERLAVGRRVAERMRASGRELGEPELVTLPTGEAVVRGTANGIALVLVPSGRMRRGFDEEQLARVDRVYEKVWYSARDPAQKKKLDRALTPFEADAPCSIDLADEVEIPAMWVAETVCEVEDEPRPWDDGPREGPPVANWQRTLAFVAEHRMTLPSSDELLWAASAGDSRLFPWGDSGGPIRDLLVHDAHALAKVYGVELEPYTPEADGDPFQIFGAANPFGLIAPLSHTTWCAPRPDLDDPAPLVRAGGAIDFYPWQGGHEAMLFLTRVVSRAAFDGRNGAPRAALRPIVRLSP